MAGRAWVHVRDTKASEPMDLPALFRRHATDIGSSLRARGVSADVAADITQDVFVKLLAGGGGTAVLHNPRAYLKRIALNLLVDRHRREPGAALVELSPDLLDEIADEAPDAERAAAARQRLAVGEAALAELPPRTRRAFEQHRLGERSLAEIADELEVSTARVWAMVRDAYGHVKRRLDEHAE